MLNALRAKIGTVAGESAQCHLLFRLSLGEVAAVMPYGAWEGSGFGAARQCALRCSIEHVVQFAVVLVGGGGRDESGPGGLDHVQNEAEAELPRFDSAAPRGQR